MSDAEFESAVVQPLLGRRRRERFDDLESLDAVAWPLISRLMTRRERRIFDGDPGMRKAVSVLAAERFAEQDAGDATGEKGFFRRLAEWIASPEGQATIKAIIAFFIELIETFGGVPA